MSPTELARQIIAIDSSVSHGTRDVAQFALQVANSWGLEAEVIDENLSGVAQATILISPKGQNRKIEKVNCGVALTSRLDTPEPGDYGRWIKTGANPFNASMSGDEIFGLGAADCKLDFICKLIALKEAAQNKTDRTKPLVVGTFGRESGAGAIRLLRKKQMSPRAVLASAPTNLRIANRAPGFAKVEISIALSDAEKKYLEQHNQIEGGHSQSKIFSRQRATLGAYSIHDNPIIKMIDYLKNMPSGMALLSVDGGTSAEVAPELVELELDLLDSIEGGVTTKLIRVSEAIKKMATELMSLRDDGFSPPHSTINLGTVRMFSEEIKLSGVCSLVPAGDRAVYEGWLDRLRNECAGAGAQFKLLDFKPPMLGAVDGAFMKFLKDNAGQTGLSDELVAAKVCTEANVFHRLGIESAVFGPGQPVELDSSALECVSVSQLTLAIEFYRNVIENFERQY